MSQFLGTELQQKVRDREAQNEELRFKIRVVRERAAAEVKKLEREHSRTKIRFTDKEKMMIKIDKEQKEDWDRVYKGSKPYEGKPPPLELIRQFWKEVYAKGYVGPN
jgi:hypothetical protein